MRRMYSLLGLFVCFAGMSVADILDYSFSGIPGSFGLTITQEFTYVGPEVTALTDVLVAGLASSSNVGNFFGYGPFAVEFDPLDTRFSFNPNSDVIRVGIPSGGAAFYYFPVDAFTTPGTYSSIGPAFSNVGTLTVSSVPEPMSIVFLGTVVAILATRYVSHRGRKEAQRSNWGSCGGHV